MFGNILGYKIFERIHEGSNTNVYRGIRLKDNLPVILKVLISEFPDSQAISRFKLEYKITKSLASDLEIAAYEFEQYQNGFVIVLEDFGGEALGVFLKSQKLDLMEFLSLAIQICDRVGRIHAANIIHKDINPSNIVFNPETRQLKLIDFGISSTLSKETLLLNRNDQLEGTLAYISPEQTGRMNRSLDYRSDLYSMGVTFYEMLTARLPFESNDPMELIHYHLALEPLAIDEIDPQIPSIISRIVMKLMAKTAEERYQSAWGVKADLEICLERLQLFLENKSQDLMERQLPPKVKIESFELGQLDIADKFSVSEKLYGREKEVESLLAAFSRIVDNQSDCVEVVLVSGYSGIGKTRLVREIYKPIDRSRGYFISGKFDLYQRNIPYFAIVRAFQGLVERLLAESEESLNKWRSQLISALGANCSLIVRVIPSLEAILGKQSDSSTIENISASEAQNRFNIVFQNFVRVFARSQHPLVIFLDDLQWADLASLKLLELISKSSEKQSLMLIGAYRNNEVNSTHPVMLMLDSIQQVNSKVHQIVLSELNLDDINRLVADTLHCSKSYSLPLAELVRQKTGGNPFFTNEFLKSLYDENLIRFDYQLRRWEWSIAQIQECGITDNIVELMAGKIQKLDDRAQMLLQIAACIGNCFDLNTLALVSDLSHLEVIHSMISAIGEGLLLPIGNVNQSLHYGIQVKGEPTNITYKFVHDRIQQAAYTLIPDSERSKIHWKVGQLILENTPIANIEDKIFDIVNQLNFSLANLSNQSERDRLAELNLLAGHKARLSCAYESSVKYCEAGLQLLENDAWSERTKLTRDLHLEAMTSSCLAGKFDLVDRFLENAYLHIDSSQDRFKFVEVQIQSLIARNRLTEAIAIALGLLLQLGVELPTEPNETMVSKALNVISQKLSTIENVLDLPTMYDPQKLAAMSILSNVASAAYIGFAALYPLIVLKQVELSLQFGNTLETAYSFSTYGLILCTIGEIEAGNRAADIALALMEKFGATSFKAKIFNLIYHFVRPWQSAIRESIVPLLEGYQAGLESGDLEFASYCAFNHCQIEYSAGDDLLKVKQDIQIYGDAIARLKQSTALNFHHICQQAVLNWLGESKNPQVLIGEVYNEAERLPLHLAANDSYSIGCVYIQKLVLTYHFGRSQDAIAIANLAEQSSGGVVGSVQFGIFYFYHALALLSYRNTDHDSGRVDWSEKIANDLKKLSNWAIHAPTNFEHRCELIRAEMASTSGNNVEAMELYDLAIAGAKENGYVQEEALANELAAKFYLAQKRITIAKAYMKEARYCYQKWGAKAKVEHLEANYQEILEGAAFYKDSSKISRLRNSTSSSSGSLEAIDLESVMRSSHAIANEIDLDRLLTTLMNILIENAGAQRGCLLLPANLSDLTEWRIDAIVSIDRDRAIGQSIPLDATSSDGGAYLPISLVDYVSRTRETLVLNNATQADNFQNDPWIIQHQSKSILCMPLLNQANLSAIVFLENNLVTDAFTPRRIEILNLLSTQAAISIGKARLLKQQEELNQSLQAEIYDRQLAESARDRLTALIQASTDIIGMSSPQGKVIWNNAQANRFIGLPADADPSDYSIPNYHPQWAQDIIQNEGIPYAIESGSWLGETALLTPNGVEIPVSQMIIAHKSIDGELEYISTIMRDISEAKKREAELKRSEATLQSLVEGTAAVTGDDFFPALVKHIAEALQVKYALVTQLIGDRLHALAFWAHGAPQSPIIYSLAHTPCEIALREGEYICKSLVQQVFPEDADLVMMQADSYMGISLKDADGNSIGNLSVLDIQPLQDITKTRNILKVFAARASAELQRKAANDALSQLNQSLEIRVQNRTIQLEAANKELESFSYSVSHDLRAPLRAIDGFSRILQEDYRDRLDAEGNRYLKIVRENAKRMGELIDDLLNLSRLNRKEISRQSISLNNLVQQILGNFESELASRQIEFVFADLPDCKADRSLITQVWINLLSNAIKYTSKTESARIEIGCQETQNEKIYFVRDNGAGFDMQYADKLFGVFQRMHLEKDFDGTGIGLAIAQRIVQRHGGRIWADAAVNLGAIFYFTIPDQGTN